MGTCSYTQCATGDAALHKRGSRRRVAAMVTVAGPLHFDPLNTYRVTWDAGALSGDDGAVIAVRMHAAELDGESVSQIGGPYSGAAHQHLTEPTSALFVVTDCFVPDHSRITGPARVASAPRLCRGVFADGPVDITAQPHIAAVADTTNFGQSAARGAALKHVALLLGAEVEVAARLVLVAARVAE
jgi:hypothetical protein